MILRSYYTLLALYTPDLFSCLHCVPLIDWPTQSASELDTETGLEYFMSSISAF